MAKPSLLRSSRSNSPHRLEKIAQQFFIKILYF
jgi:hypothetical protein